MSLVEKAMEKIKGAAAQGAQLRATPSSFGKQAEVGLHALEATHSQKTVAIEREVLRRAGLLAPENEERTIGQQFRQIKRPLLEHARDRTASAQVNDRSIMVASALAGEGKTFTSVNLAFSMAAEQDVEVVLVDADLLKPHLTRVLGLSEAPGLMDLLRDSSIDPNSLIVSTDVRGLSVLPAGTRIENSTETLTSTRVKDIARAITDRNPARIVLFDSPPLLMTSESQVIAHGVGQVVVVVRIGVTEQSTLLDALSYIGDRQAVSLVLNQSSRDWDSARYYYGYSDPRSDGQPG